MVSHSILLHKNLKCIHNLAVVTVRPFDWLILNVIDKEQIYAEQNMRYNCAR